MLTFIRHRALVAYAAAAYLVLVAPAAADVVHSSPALTLQGKQTWALLIGSLVPLGTYVINHVGPWVSEPAKALFLVLMAAVAGGLYTALSTNSFGWNSATLQMVVTSVAAALAAHKLLWQPSTISARLGAGTKARRRLVWVVDTSAPPADPPVA